MVLKVKKISVGRHDVEESLRFFFEKLLGIRHQDQNGRHRGANHRKCYHSDGCSDAKERTVSGFCASYRTGPVLQGFCLWLF